MASIVLPPASAICSGEISAPPTVRRTLGSRWTTSTPALSSSARMKRASSPLVSCVMINITLGLTAIIPSGFLKLILSRSA